MSNSISVDKTEDGYVPQIVVDKPHTIGVFPTGKACLTWKEAWWSAKQSRSKTLKG